MSRILAIELIRAAEPFCPVLEELRRRGNEKCNERRQLCCIPDTDSETDSFQGDCIEVVFVFDGSLIRFFPGWQVSMLPNGILSHHPQTAPRPTMAILRRGRGAEVLHRAYKWSSLLQATKPRLPPDLLNSIYLLEIHHRIDRNERLQRRLAHSTKLLRNAERIAIGEGNTPALV
jgi:hypothetical protein